MSNTKPYFLFAVIFNFIVFTGFAQLNRCGTVLTGKQINFEQNFTDSVNSIIVLNRTLNVTLFIVKDNQGMTNIDMSEFNTAFSGLNVAFNKIKLSFRISSINYIDNYHFDALTKNINEPELIIQNSVSNTINLYLVKNLYDATNQEVCGYTYFPSEGKDVIFINKSCIGEAILIEQFGHFFNLYHTHEKGFAEELVNRSNCSTAGDLCCDTPADPNLFGKVTHDCHYLSLDQDQNKEYYTPSVFNYMSFSPDNCGKCFFSDEQHLRIVNCMLKTKSHLW